MAEAAVEAEAATGHQDGDQGPEAAGMGEQLEAEAAEGPVGPGAGVAPLELRPRLLQEGVVLDAGRAGRHAGHAPETAVEVLGHRAHVAARLLGLTHEDDTTAGG